MLRLNLDFLFYVELYCLFQQGTNLSSTCAFSILKMIVSLRNLEYQPKRNIVPYIKKSRKKNKNKEELAMTHYFLLQTRIYVHSSDFSW